MRSLRARQVGYGVEGAVLLTQHHYSLRDDHDSVFSDDHDSVFSYAPAGRAHTRALYCISR